MELHSPQSDGNPREDTGQPADLGEIKRAIALMFQPGQVYEVRSFPRGTTSGYFNDFDKMAVAVANLSGRGPAVYCTLNPVLPDLLARSANRVKQWAKTTTVDSQITRRRWLPIDVDPQRPADISSSETEHGAAIDRAMEVREWLAGFCWPEPIFADSGNGAHLLYRLELPNDVAATTLLMNCLKALSFRLDDEGTKVDTGNFNAARIWKVYGTLCCKGDNVLDRPHRLARILEAPERLELVSEALLQSLAAMAPQQPTATPRQYRGAGEPFDLEEWIAKRDIPILYHGTWNGGDKWVLARCLWNHEHSDKSAYILRFPNGAIAAGCHHNGCQGLGWPELREVVEPGYRERRAGQRPTTPAGGYKRKGRVYLPSVEVTL